MKHALTFLFVSALLTFISGRLDSAPHSGPSPRTERIQPSDLTYKGAFRLPDSSVMDIGFGWEWSGWASGMAHYPDGDPSGTDDGYPGSIFGVGHSHYKYVAEINIPVPVVSAGKNLSELNTAEMLQDFSDITGGLYGEQEMPRMGLAYLPAQGSQTSGKLYFCSANHLQDTGLVPSHGWSELTLSSPQTKGLWNVGNYWNYLTCDYMFPIDETWANTYTPGKRLITGRMRDGGQASEGPTLFAIGPWNEGNPPANGATITATPLLMYQAVTDDNPACVTNYHHSDDWSGGEWVSAGGASAVILVGTKGYGNCWYGYADGTVWEDPYPEPGPGERGWWSSWFVGEMLFYDIDQLAQVATGQRAAYDLQPYAVMDLDPYLYHITSTQMWQHVAAASFDSNNGLLYVFEPMVDNEKPIVHVWSVSGSPPSAPVSVTATDGLFTNKIQVAWSEASDVTSYEIWRGESNNSASAALLSEVTGRLYDDTNVVTGTIYYYWLKSKSAYGTSAFSTADSGYAQDGTPSLTPVYRLYSYGAAESTYEHLWTTSSAERDTLDSWPSWGYEGVAWHAYRTEAPDTVPLYRLYASSVKQHHYTIDIHEYNTLNENNPAWVGEGIQYFVYSTDTAAGLYPAYRFYHSQLYLHHFTIDENEMTQINAHPEWGYEYEGIGFYVFATASKI